MRLLLGVPGWAEQIRRRPAEMEYLRVAEQCGVLLDYCDGDPKTVPLVQKHAARIIAYTTLKHALSQ